MRSLSLSVPFLLLLLLAIPSAGADELVTTLEFDAADLGITEHQGLHFLTLPDGVPTGPVGAPALPAVRKNVALPWNGLPGALEILSVETVELDESFLVAPMTRPRTVSGGEPLTDPFIRDPDYYGRDEFLPGTHGELIATWDLVGQRFAKIELNPVQYNPVTRKIRLATKITFRITWIEQQGPDQQVTYNLTEAGRADYKRHLESVALNPEAVSIPAFAGSSSRSLPSGQYEHVIITPQAFESYWADLVEWHTRKGYPSCVVTKEYIQSNYSGTDTAKIQSFVQDAHQTWGTRYFLIGADGGTSSLQVPYHERYLLGEYVPNDTFYADYNGNWVIDVHVGRASVTSTASVGQFIDKVLKYEQDPPSTSYANRAFFMGFDLDSSTPGEDTKVLIKNNDIPGTTAFQSEYDSESGAHINDVTSVLNTGPNLVNHIDHCNWSVWGIGSVNHGDHYYDSNVNALTNGWRLINWYSLGCLASAWDYGTSISETFMRRVGQAGVSFTGNTRYGWYNPGYANTLSSLYDIRWWHVLFTDNRYHVGETLSYHKNDYYPNSDYYKYIFTELNLLGDPAMRLWKLNPTALTVTGDDPIYTGSQSYSVNVKKSGSNVNGALVCLWKGSEVYKYGLTNSSGNASFTIDPATSGTMLVTATVQNALPYMGSVTVQAGGPPVLTGITPQHGPVAGGTSCTISGYNFTTTQATTVRFGGTPATGVNVVSSTLIICSAPAHASGLVDVQVTNENGSDQLLDAFTYHDAPDLTGVTPDSGPMAGGTAVTLSGSDFTSVGGTTVHFDGLNASGVQVVNDTTITCTTPAHAAGLVDVEVSNDFGNDVLSNGFTYNSPPVISSINPSQGPMSGGTSVTITGNHFTTSIDTNVTFGGHQASNVQVLSATQLICVTPSHATGPVDVTVSNSNGYATLPDGFTYYTSPLISSVDPNHGPLTGGTAVTVYGSNFTNSLDTQVTFGGQQATNVIVVDFGTLTCLTPAHGSGAVDVSVSNSFGTGLLVNGYTYEYPPQVTSVVPADGHVSGATSVTVYGSNFTSSLDTQVTFGGVSATGVDVVNGQTLTCVTPANPPGAVDVAVTTSNGTGTLPAGFTYHASPTISQIDPDNGTMAGGADVTLTGNHFTPGDTDVLFGGVSATDIVVVNATTITCKTPASVSSGPVDVKVQNFWGSDTVSGGYTYNPPPQITGVTPAVGLYTGGETVTVTGQHFTPALFTEITFNGLPATNVTVVDDTTITCDTPAQPVPDILNVALTNSNGTDDLPSGFECIPPQNQAPMNFMDKDTLDLYPGDLVRHSVTGAPGATYMLFLSIDGGPLNTPWGVMGLGIPMTHIWTSNLNAYGYQTVPILLVDVGIGFFNFYTHCIVDDSPPIWAVGGNNPNGSGSIMWGLH